MNSLRQLMEWPGMRTALGLLALMLLAWLVGVLVRSVLLRVVHGIAARTEWRWDDALCRRRSFFWLARMAPMLVVQYGIARVPDVSGDVEGIVVSISKALLVLCLAMAISSALSALEDLYRETPRGRERSIKGVVQLAKIGLFVVAGLVIVTALTGQRIGLLLSGLGAMSAVLMLVFKDTILGFVAGVQLSSNDMLRVGDWIEMPQLNADGDVIDIALHTVKVRNWDKTITTIPSWRLISDSYKNWRGMQETGGRRIKRVLTIDAGSVRFLDGAALDRLAKLRLLADYLPAKQQEVAEWNRALGEAGGVAANRRRLTNLGTFRAYVQVYLDTHPRIHHGLSCMVRQLASGSQGIPLELYCFTDTVVWADYEAIQADIFDYLFALLPEFGLRLYQQPSGHDMQAGLARLDGGRAESRSLQSATS
ncbi:mechanosensitive ion channel family protein [Dyella agri]|uniref:Mechanosensitive ion channel n=1 Tax=Dyella agri TaxID=1926869 RepID=A0ABW8KEI7_9GAMM